MRGTEGHVIESESGQYDPAHVFHEHNGYYSGWE